MGTMVAAERVYKSYGRVQALRGLDLEIPARTITCLIGPSGSGKSTLLRCIAHLDTIDSGRLWVNGCLAGFREVRGRFHAMRPRELARRRREYGLVSAPLNLFPHLTVLQNVYIGPLYVPKEAADVVRTRAANLLRRFDVMHLAEVYPGTLSGGEQQRVAVVRALAMQPSILLLDEPTSALDPWSTQVLCEVLRESADNGTTVIMVTSDIGLARHIGDVLVEMNAGRTVDAAIRRRGAEDLGRRLVGGSGPSFARPSVHKPRIDPGSAEVLSFP